MRSTWIRGLRLPVSHFLFTDLKGSTELYERVGDLVAYDLVRAHFRVLHEIVAAESGAVVKTIGDAVMATFPTPDRAMAAALKMREALKNLKGDLLLKIGIHEGPCLAVSLNDRQDYFGRTVNIAARVQGLATSRPFSRPEGSLLTAKPRSCCNQTVSPRPRRSARSGALPTRSRFLKYPEVSKLRITATIA